MKRPRSKSALALKLAEMAQTGRYGLLVWVRSNYADLAAARTELRLSFELMAEAAAEAGVRNGQGNKPKPWTVRKFFKQVEMEHQTVPSDPASKPELGVGQGAPHQAEAGLDASIMALRKGRLRGHVPKSARPGSGAGREICAHADPGGRGHWPVYGREAAQPFLTEG